MTAVKEIAALLFGRLGQGGTFAVLTAYFDDSGTHKGAPVVLYGGVVGDDGQWAKFEEAWKAQLRQPTKGKPPIKRLHMYDLETGFGEFEDYNIADRDNTIYNFRKIILDAELQGYVCAFEIKAYDELIVQPLRLLWGDAEQHCATNCILRMGMLAAGIGANDEVALVFDNRPSRNEANRKVFEIFQRFSGGEPALGRFKKALFESSIDSCPLQAADLVANEYYRFVRQVVDNDGKPLKPRAHLLRLFESGRFTGEMGLREQLEQMAAHIKIDPTQAALARLVLGLPDWS